MAVNLGNLFHYLIPLAFCVAGFHGVFYFSNLWKKIAGWCIFQTGLMAFLMLLAPPGNDLAYVLTVGISACTLAGGILLAAFCVKLGRRYKTFDGAEMAKKGSK